MLLEVEYQVVEANEVIETANNGFLKKTVTVKKVGDICHIRCHFLVLNPIMNFSGNLIFFRAGDRSNHMMTDNSNISLIAER